MPAMAVVFVGTLGGWALLRGFQNRIGPITKLQALGTGPRIAATAQNGPS